VFTDTFSILNVTQIPGQREIIPMQRIAPNQRGASSITTYAPQIPMPASRDEWHKKLEILSSSIPSEAEDTWRWVMKGLGLDYDYYLANVKAINQGRWRDAKDPRAYLLWLGSRWV
jgi:hypothetical protein